MTPRPRRALNIIHAARGVGPLVAAGLASAALLATRTARAQSTIHAPGYHPHYVFEAEPHMLLGLARPFDHAGEVGAGFRGTVILMSPGFVRSINDSVGIGFGADAGLGSSSGHVL